MGTITTSTGLVSGIDYTSIVDQLIELERRPVTLLENRNVVLEAQQTAYQTISANLLSLRTLSSQLAQPLNFRKTSAASSNESVFSVSASASALPGNYNLRVKQLVTSQQTLSSGFADRESALGISTTMILENGKAKVSGTTSLDNLNGGEGIDRGYIRITDRSGSSELIDLSDAVTLEEVVETINQATSIDVTASIEDDALVINDNTGFITTSLKIQDVGGNNTATSLGIVGTAFGNTLTGTQINTIGNATSLASLNDGNGIGTLGGANDFSITDRGGTTYNINLDGINNVKELAELIDDETSSAVTLSVASDGVSFELVDNTFGGGALTVAALNDSTAAEDLGIVGSSVFGNISGERAIAAPGSKLLKNLNGGAGFLAFGGSGSSILKGQTRLDTLISGSGLSTTGVSTADLQITARDASTVYDIDLDSAETVQDLIDAVSDATDGKVTLGISGNRLIATDQTGEEINNLVIADATGSSVATELGLAIDTSNTVVTGADLAPTVTNAGAEFTITDSSGASQSLDFSSAESLSDILDTINDSGLGVVASINSAGNGIEIIDEAGGAGSLTIADDFGSQLATQLGLTGTYTSGEANSGNLNFGYIRNTTSLDSLDVTAGEFQITDAKGITETFDLDSSSITTLQDVIDLINGASDLEVNARINDAGNGLILENTNTGGDSSKIKVSESGSSTAADLGLLGSSESIGADFVGSFSKSVDILATDTLDNIANKLNNAGAGVSVSVISDGSASTPYRLSLTSRDSGTTGAFIFDDGGADLGTFNLNEAQDAVVFLGASSSYSGVMITSDSNTVSNAVQGVTFNLKSSSEDVVQATISQDISEIRETISSFVESFNELITTIDTYDAYDSENEERGLLLGDTAVNNVRQQLYDMILGSNSTLSQELNSLTEIGIKISNDSGGLLEFDTDKFDKLWEEDSDAVINLFTIRTTVDDDEDGEDDVDEDGEDILSAEGYGYQLNDLLIRLTDAEFGPLEAAVNRLSEQVEANESRIDSLEDRLETKREVLTNQFIAMETALSELSSQQSVLSNFFSNNSSSSS